MKFDVRELKSVLMLNADENLIELAVAKFNAFHTACKQSASVNRWRKNDAIENSRDTIMQFNSHLIL